MPPEAFDTSALDPEGLRLVLYPDPGLKQRCVRVPAVDDRVRACVDRMFELMREAEGVGLAAPQVGLPLRLFVANWTGEPGDDHAYINPELFDPGRRSAAEEEGCLSLPNVRVEVDRPKKIRIRALDRNGAGFEDSGDGLKARVWQHEFDHLEGRLITDRMSEVDRLANRAALAALTGAS